VAAVISIAAIVDPFSWLPPVGEIWAHCEEDPDTEPDCDLAERYPGFWEHVIANFAYFVAALALLFWLAVAVANLRDARARRFSDRGAAQSYGDAREVLAAVAVLVALLAALPVIVAIA
jgi:hypothetical protein